MNKFKKILVSTLAMIVAVTSTNANIFAKNEEPVLKPGEVTQNKTATWNDYSKGIAEISFDVVGKSVEEPVDVVILYDNSGSMQLSETSYGDYLTSRWYYASEAAKTFSDSLLQSEGNNVAFVPFSDVLIDGNSEHLKPTDFFETHDFIYDENGNPDIGRMFYFAGMYEVYLNAPLLKDWFYENCEKNLNLTKKNVDDLIGSGQPGKNTKNAVVPFTKDVKDINNAIDSLYPSHAGETNYEIALKKAQELFEKNNNKDSNKVIVMISDGKPNKGGDSVKIANELKASGVTIYTCGTAISDADAGVLKAIASVENNAPFYCSSKPSDLEKTLETIRKEIGIAAEQAVIEDQINSEYFEYFVDETHYPTVNGVKITDKEIVVSKDKNSITWNIGNIREEKKTLKFYVKVKDTLLNKDLLDKDQSFLNNVGDYATNKKANLSYKEVNSDNFITTGHEMESPKVSVSTASMKQTYYLSDASGNYVEENGQKVVLLEETSNNKALGIEYIITPKQNIEIDGVKYFILKEDNKETKKTFSNNDSSASFTYRLVKQLNVTFDTNGLGQFSDSSIIKNEEVNHKTMTVDNLPEVTTTTSGRHFIGWNTDKNGNGQTFDTTYVVKNNMTVYAQYGHDSLNVIFQDENKNIYKKQTVEYGTAA
ncbi:MAG: VWA domain-containing protein, partial [Coprobacillus sp.]